jgi:hypothetical protein
MNLKIDIFQSFLIPFNRDSEEIHKEFERSKRALKNLAKIDLEIPEVLSAVMIVEEVIRKNSELKTFWEINKRYIRKEIIYKFSVNVRFSTKQSENLDEEILVDEIEKRFYEFLMILNICRVGGFHFGIGCIKKREQYLKLKNLAFYSKELFKYSLEKKWPSFENLGIQQTWKWYLKKVNPRGVDEISSSNLSRAFNALSYLYEKSEYINELFWTLIGLEAIYVKGKEGISEQITNKGQLFLGEIEEFKRRLSKMYKFRSAFIHGRIDFPGYFHIYDNIDSFENFSSEIFEVLLTAESMLIATLQKMAKNNMKELDFKYVIV